MASGGIYGRAEWRKRKSRGVVRDLPTSPRISFAAGARTRTTGLQKKRLMDPFKRLPAERIARPRRKMVITVINTRIPAELSLEPRM